MHKETLAAQLVLGQLGAEEMDTSAQAAVAAVEGGDAVSALATLQQPSP